MKTKDKITYNLWFKWTIWAITSVLCIYYFIKGQMGYIEGGVMFLASAIGIDIFLKLIKIKLSDSTDFIIQLFIFACLFMGKMYNIYSILPWWDSFVHFISGILLGIGSLLLLTIQVKEDVIKKLQPIFIATYGFLSSVAAAGLWEIWEFAGDQLFGLNSQGNSLMDTMTDICMGASGGIIAAILIYIYFKNGTFKFIGDFMDTFLMINKKNTKK